MSIFGRKKNTEETKKTASSKEVKVVKDTPANPQARDFSHSKSAFISILKSPRITEKAGMKAESQNVYTFEVEKGASKDSIRKAIMDVYKVRPVKVAIVQTPSKNVLSRGKRGVQPGGKKAYIYLKTGEKIDFI